VTRGEARSAARTARLAARHAWRETRASWRSFIALLACVTTGVAALAGVGTLATNLDRTLAREAKSLLGGDIEIRSTRSFGSEVADAVSRVAAAGASVSSTTELVGMARHVATGRTLLVELKAVEATYPLYGRLETTSAVRTGVVVVAPQLLERLGASVGDRLVLGAAELTIGGVVTHEPDRPASVVTLGPRVMLTPADLERTALVQHGSRVRLRTLVRLVDGVDPRPLRDEMARATTDPAVRVVTYDDAQPGLRRFFGQMTTYLGLVGLVALLVGGIGVASSVFTFMRRRLATIAILKTLGAESKALLAAYLLQTGLLGLAGSVAGAALGVAAQPMLAWSLGTLLPFTLEIAPDPWTIARAVLMGVLVTLLCGFWPLARLSAVKPSLILRATVEPRLPRARRPWLAAAPIGAGLAALALWQAGSFRVAGIFLGASLAAVLLLLALARGVVALARSVRFAQGPALRHGLASLQRPGGQSVVVVVALGVGVMLLVAVGLLEQSLRRQMDHERRRDAPSFVCVDVQEDQRDRFAATVARASGGAAPALTPVVRARLAAVNGMPVTRETVDRRAVEKRWYFTRDYVLTAMADPPGGNTIVRGRWWTAHGANGLPRVSLEEEAATVLGVDVGGRLTFDVQGVPVEAQVESVRRVDWQSLTLNFFVIFSPGTLDGAPTTYVGTARVPAQTESAVQDAVVSAFPNVTAVPVRDVLERVSAIVDQLGVAIRAVALFSIASGLAVMLGALAASRYQRLYESVVWRTLGATRATVARAFAVEYGCLGAAAGVGGTALAAVLAWVVLRFVLSVPWTFEPWALVLGVAAAIALAVTVGFLATFRLLGAKPLAVLRQE
jgi:putative ABC transport system permease protein